MFHLWIWHHHKRPGLRVSSAGRSPCPREREGGRAEFNWRSGCFYVTFMMHSHASPVLKDTRACSADDVVDDLSRHRLRADQPDCSTLVQQAVKFLRSLHHCLLGITRCWVRNMWNVLLHIAVHPVIALLRDKRLVWNHGDMKFKSKYTILHFFMVVLRKKNQWLNLFHSFHTSALLCYSTRDIGLHNYPNLINSSMDMGYYEP